MKITFNYKDGVKQLNLREFEGSSLESSGAVDSHKKPAPLDMELVFILHFS